MPQLLPVVAAAVGASAVVQGLLFLGVAAFSSYQQRKAERKARAAYNAAQVDRLVNVAATVQPRMLVLGRVRVGGHVFFRGSVGAYREKFVMLVALAGHEIDAVEQIWLNDLPVTLDAGGYVQTAPYVLSRTSSAMAFIAPSQTSIELPYDPLPGSVYAVTLFNTPGDGEVRSVPISVTGRTVTLLESIGSAAANVTYQYTVLTPKARVRAYLGTDSQTADAQVIADFPGLWSVAHQARGVAYLVCEYWYDETAFPSGLPVVTATVRGAKVYDPRTGLTAWSRNPALLARHVLLHQQFGKRVSLTASEEARIEAAANACDIVHDYGEGAVPMYRADTAVPFGTQARDVLDDLAQAMAGQWAYAGGEVHMRAGVYTAPVLSLGDSDLAVRRTGGDGSISSRAIGISPHTARADKFNKISPRIWDAAQDWQQVVIKPVEGAALIAADGAELVQEVEMPAVTYAQQAQHVAGVLLRDARDPLTVTLPFKLTAYRLELFNCVSLTLSRYGWSNKEFVVIGRQWTIDGGLLLTLKETASAIFQPDAEFVASGYARNSALPTPWNIQPPSPITCSSGTSELIVQADGTVLSRVRVTWPAVVDQSVLQGGSVEVQWAPVAVDPLTWTSILTSAINTEVLFYGMADGDAILVRARTVTQLAQSDWCPHVTHIVVGKTEPPPDVTGLAANGELVSWEPVDVPDLAGYLLRFQYGSESAWWDTAVPMHEGVLTSSPYQLTRRPQGDVTLLIKAVDTSGNVSANPAAVTTGFAPIAVRNVAAALPQHPDFLGDITGGTVAGGDLLANNTDSFYEPADGPMYLPAADPMYGASQYSEMVYEFTVFSTESGTLLLLYTISAESLLIEYRARGGDPMYEPASDPMYEPAAESIYGDFPPWSVWPGSFDFNGAVEVQFRLTLAGGLVQGAIYDLTAVVDAPEVSEVLDDMPISAAGTRLALTNSYRAINNVSLTVQADGGSGVSARLKDKDPVLGPLVEVLNSAGTPVDGLLDAVIRGY